MPILVPALLLAHLMAAQHARDMRTVAILRQTDIEQQHVQKSYLSGRDQSAVRFSGNSNSRRDSGKRTIVFQPKKY